MGLSIIDLEGLRRYSQKAFPKLAKRDTEEKSNKSVPTAFSLHIDLEANLGYENIIGQKVFFINKGLREDKLKHMQFKPLITLNPDFKGDYVIRDCFYHGQLVNKDSPAFEFNKNTLQTKDLPDHLAEALAERSKLEVEHLNLGDIVEHGVDVPAYYIQIPIEAIATATLIFGSAYSEDYLFALENKGSQEFGNLVKHAAPWLVKGLKNVMEIDYPNDLKPYNCEAVYFP